MQHLFRCILKLGNRDLSIAELPDSIDTRSENPYKMQDYFGISIMEFPRHFVEKIFPDINANFLVPEQQWIFGSQKGQYQHQRTARFIR